RHSFEGNWKRGKPHGRGIYTFEEGKFYEGSIKNGVADGQGTLTLPDGTTQAGYWEKGEYLGSFLQPYVFATLPLETNYDLKRTGSDKNQVTFKTTLQGLPISPDNLDLVASSGVPFQFADKFGLENVEFPVTIDCTYKVLQGFNTVDIKFRFTIYQAGEWTMTMRH
ncbi:MAG TPA: hypothetical protein DCE41_32125, partial [Cytophagales bacterium]|nr:hypothetical protein [Cytophagales bacterium]